MSAGTPLFRDISRYIEGTRRRLLSEGLEPTVEDVQHAIVSDGICPLCFHVLAPFITVERSHHFVLSRHGIRTMLTRAGEGCKTWTAIWGCSNRRCAFLFYDPSDRTGA